MKKTGAFLLLMTLLESVSFGQNGQKAETHTLFKTIEKLQSINIHGFEALKKSESKQEILPDSASIYGIIDGDSVYGYINFTYTDTLHIEALYLKDSIGYHPYYKDEYHFENPTTKTGYVIRYIGNEFDEWIPDSKEEILSRTCTVAGFLWCSYGISREYTWNSERSDWRGSSSSTVMLYDSLGRKTESANLQWNDELYDWESINKYVWEYNTNGLIISKIEYNWDETLDTIVLSSKTLYEYDMNDSITLDCYLEWNLLHEKWDTIQKREYSYNGNNIYETFSKIDEETGDLKLFRYLWQEFTYNGKNLLAKQSQYSKKSEAEAWHLGIQNTYTYNGNNKLTEWISDWITFQMRNTYQYNALGMITLHSFHKKYTNDNIWKLESEKKYTYDSRGNMLQQQHFYTNSEDQKNWGWRETYTYDDFNNQTIKINSTLVLPDSIFVNSRKYEKLTNTLGNITQIAEYEWDTTLNIWIGQYGLNEYFYEKGLVKKNRYSEWNNETNEWAAPSSFEEFFYKGLKLEIDSIQTDCDIANACSIHIYASGGEGKYFYSIDNQSRWYATSSFTELAPGTYHVFIKDELGTTVEYLNNPIVIAATATQQINSSGIRISPNPFNDMIHIKMDNPSFTIAIYNTMGQSVYYSGTNSFEQSIEFNNAEKGIYLICIHSSEGYYTQKIFKK